MYPQFGDARFPAEIGPGSAQGGVDSSAVAGRYSYGPYYGSKGPDGHPFGTMNPAGGGIPSYGGKPLPTAAQDGFYASRWPSPGYVRAPGPKPQSDYFYSGQPTSGSSYPKMSHMVNVAGYPVHPPNYALGAQFSGQYPFTSSGYAAPAMTSGSVYIDGVTDVSHGNSSSSVQYPPPRSPWSQKLVTSGVTKGQESSEQSPQWSYHGSESYSSNAPNTPTQQQPTATNSPQIEASNHSVEQQTGLIRQQSQPSMSPRTHYDNELQKQPSVSSLRDALLSTPSSTSQQISQPYAYSPRVPGGHSSPMTPTTNLPHTPDASTPAGGSSVMSPHLQQQFDDKQESQLTPAEPELVRSFAQPNTEENNRPVRVSPFQVESILGMEVNSVSGQDSNSILSPQEQAVDRSQEPALQNNVHLGDAPQQSKADSLLPMAPSNFNPFTENSSTVKVESSPAMSPVDSTHPSIVSQYHLSDDQMRKEFLDALFAFLDGKGIGLVRPPTLFEAPVDLFKTYNRVQQLGGFLNVMENNLWPDVLKSLNPSLNEDVADTMRTLFHLYVKLLLPYECHLKHLNMTECLAKVQNSVLSQAKKNDPRVNHDDKEGLNELDQIIQGGKMNGEAGPQAVRMSRRLNSQTSESSTGEVNSQETEVGAMPVATPNVEEQESDLVIPKDSQGPVGDFPPDMDSDDPLPEISAQETESLLAMPASPYHGPGQPGSAGGPCTPSASQATPPSSYPPPYPPHGSQEWVPPPGQEMYPSSGYPPSYAVDPSHYRPPPHPPSIPPGYSPYNPPSQHDLPIDYHIDMPSPIIHSPYETNPYMVPPGMPNHPASRPAPYFFRPPMMARQDPFGMRPGEMPYPGASGMTPEWAWAQSSRYPSMIPHPSLYSHSRHNPSIPLSSPRVHIAPQSSVLGSQQRSTPTPTSSEISKSNWPEQAKSSQPTKASEKGTQSFRSSKSEATSKAGPAKPEPTHLVDSLKRPLPDWSGCVEGTKPVLTKRRQLLSVDCGNVEPWRVMMSLKSGLLSESTWALDTLNILLHDDTTVGYFHLKHHHSLLDTLIDHFSKVLIAIFGDEFEPPCTDQTTSDGVDAADVRSDNDEMQQCVPESRSTSVNRSNANDFAKVTAASDPEHIATPFSIIESVSMNVVTALERDNRLSHIEIPTADEKLLFPTSNSNCRISLSSLSSPVSVDRFSRVQRIDETPVSDLLHKEGLKNQLPLHYFGRSPRRRECSILEDIQIREDLEKEIDERLLPENEEKESDQKHSRSVSREKDREVFSSTHTSNATKVVKEESEIIQKEILPLWSLSPNKEVLQGRCLLLSNILRSLSFIPGNDVEFSQHRGVLTILGHILMLYHNHLVRQKSSSLPVVNGECNSIPQTGDSTSKPPPRFSANNQETEPADDVWWWDCLDVLRENALVVLSNIAGQLDLSIFPESVSHPIVNGLLHWVTCPSAKAVDPLPDTAVAYALSPQRLVLEALAKISISEVNVDFILATPPITRLDTLFLHLVQFIGQKKFPVMRQFALVLLSNLAQGNEAASRLLAQQKMVVPLLVECIESSEQASCSSRGQLVGGYNPDDPQSLSVAMLRRAATTLHCLAKVPLNRTVFLPYRDRTLYLATSQYVEPSVSSILMDMLFELGKL